MDDKKEDDDSKAAVAVTDEPKSTIGSPPLIQPKPKLSKAERRALQEQQRAAKAARQGAVSSTQPPSKAAEKRSSSSSADHSNKTVLSKPSPNVEVPTSGVPQPETRTNNANMLLNNKTTGSAKTTTTTTTSLVGHLPRMPPVNVTFDTGAVLRANHKKTTTSTSSSSDQPYPDAVVRLGYLYATGQIRGGNARCRAMLECYQEILAKTAVVVSPPPDVVIKSAFHFWTTQCRAHSVTMGNAFTFLKAAVASLMQQHNNSSSPSMIRETLLDIIETYKQERIEYADKAIADIACQKLLSNRDEVILTFGYSEAVALVLEKAQMKRVIVVDSPPLLEGLYTYNSLSKTPDYIDITALTYVLPEVDKVLLGASALQTDGSITSRIGTAVVALAAHTHHIPVIFCAETYKISNRGVPLESLTHNEILVNHHLFHQKEDETSSSSTSLQLLYDLTPAKWISGIVTELGLVPPSSVAVLLREMNPQEFKAAQ